MEEDVGGRGSMGRSHQRQDVEERLKLTRRGVSCARVMTSEALPFRREREERDTTHDAEHDHIPQSASHSPRLLQLLVLLIAVVSRFLQPVTDTLSRRHPRVGVEHSQRLV